MGDDARDELGGEHQLGFGAAHHARHLHVLGVDDLGHDMVGLGAAVRVVGDRQHSLDDARVGVVVFRAQHHDGAGRVEADDLQIAQLDGVAGAADDAGAAGGAHLFANDALHLDFVFFAQDDNAGIALVGVGDDQLGGDGDDLLVPAQDDGVALLDDARAAALKRFDPLRDGGVEHADEDAHPEQAAQGDDQHEQQVLPGFVGVHRVGGEGLGQDVPKHLAHAQAAGDGIEGQHGQGSGGDQDGGSQGQPADEGDGATRQGVIEAVAQSRAERSCFQHMASSGFFWFDWIYQTALYRPFKAAKFNTVFRTTAVS